MKKNYLFVALAALCLSGYAQERNMALSSKLPLTNKIGKMLPLNKKELRQTMVQVHVENSDAKLVATPFTSIRAAVRARMAAVDTISTSYGRPDGTFFEGYTRDYKAYSSLWLHSPAEVAVDYAPWASDNAATFSWSYNSTTAEAITDSVSSDGTLHFITGITPSGYISYLPKVTAKTSYDDASFVLGQGVANKYLFASSVERSATADGTDMNGVDEFPSMTLGNMFENKPASGNLYGSTAGGAYSPAYSNTSGACKGFMQIIPQLVSPYYMESASLLAYEIGGTAVPAGGVMKMQFYYLNTDGSLGDLIAESTTNAFVKTYSTQGVFLFKFQKEEDGFVVDKPVTLGTKAPIAVVITGFNSTWNFRALFGVNKTLGSSYTLHGDNLAASTFGYSNAPTTPRTDLYIQFNGIFNCLSPYGGSQSLTFPAEGGLGVAGYSSSGSAYNDVDLNSAFNVDANMTNVWVESAPSWVNGMETDSTYFADYKVIAFFFKAEALPAGVTSRSGEIVISSYGVSAKIPVVQSSSTDVQTISTTGIVVTARENSFKMSYPSAFNSVEVYNVAGRQLGKYTLSDAGSATIPADNAKGIYLLRFSGAKTETIKILK